MKVWRPEDTAGYFQPELNEAQKAGLGLVDELQAFGGGIVGLGAQGLSQIAPAVAKPTLEGVRDWGLETYNKNMEEAAAGRQAPNVARIEDIKLGEEGGVERLTDWATYGGLKALGTLGVIAATGMGGGMLAKAATKQGVKALARHEASNFATREAALEAGKRVAAARGFGESAEVGMQTAANAAKELAKNVTRGQVAGASLGAFGLEGGSAFGEQVRSGVSPEDALVPSATVGAMNAALELTPFYMAAKAMGYGKAARDGLLDTIRNTEGLAAKTRKLAGEVLRRGGPAALGGAATEGLTEAMQEITQIAGQKWAEKSPIFEGWGEEEWSRVKNAAAIGALVGGGVGGVIGQAGRPGEQAPGAEPPPAQETLEEAIARAREAAERKRALTPVVLEGEEVDGAGVGTTPNVAPDIVDGEFVGQELPPPPQRLLPPPSDELGGGVEEPPPGGPPAGPEQDDWVAAAEEMEREAAARTADTRSPEAQAAEPVPPTRLPISDDPSILNRYFNEEDGMEARVVAREDGQFATVLWDVDNEQPAGVRIFPTQEAADVEARKLVGTQVVPVDESTPASQPPTEETKFSRKLTAEEAAGKAGEVVRGLTGQGVSETVSSAAPSKKAAEIVDPTELKSLEDILTFERNHEARRFAKLKDDQGRELVGSRAGWHAPAGGWMDSTGRVYAPGEFVSVEENSAKTQQVWLNVHPEDVQFVKDNFDADIKEQSGRFSAGIRMSPAVAAKVEKLLPPTRPARTLFGTDAVPKEQLGQTWKLGSYKQLVNKVFGMSYDKVRQGETYVRISPDTGEKEVKTSLPPRTDEQIMEILQQEYPGLKAEHFGKEVGFKYDGPVYIRQTRPAQVSQETWKTLISNYENSSLLELRQNIEAAGIIVKNESKFTTNNIAYATAVKEYVKGVVIEEDGKFTVIKSSENLASRPMEFPDKETDFAPGSKYERKIEPGKVANGNGAWSYARTGQQQETTAAQLEEMIAKTFGKWWLKKAKELGILRIFKGKGPGGASGLFNRTDGSVSLFAQSMPADENPLGVVLHEGSHQTLRMMLGDRMVARLFGDVLGLVKAGDKNARQAYARADWEATAFKATKLGVEHSMHQPLSAEEQKAERARVEGEIKKITKELDEVMLALLEKEVNFVREEELLSYYVQFSAGKKGGMWRRIVNQTKVSWLESDIGQALKSVGLGPKASDEMMVALARRATEFGVELRETARRLRGEPQGTLVDVVGEQMQRNTLASRPGRGADLVGRDVIIRPGTVVGGVLYSRPGQIFDSPEFLRWTRGLPVKEAGEPFTGPAVVHAFHAGWFDENEDSIGRIGKEGWHFGTKAATDDRQGGKQVDDMIRSLVVEEQDGRWFWSMDGMDSFDMDEEGFASEAEARQNAEDTASGQGDYFDAELMPVTEAFIRLENPTRMEDQKGDWTAAVAEAKAKGHDSIIYRNMFEDKGRDSYVVLKEEAVKSVNNGGMWGENADVLASRPLWRSPLLEAVDAVKQPSATGQQWAAMLEKTPGVKKEEGEDMGLWDWLKGVGKVGKEEVRRFVEAGGVRLEENLKGGMNPVTEKLAGEAERGMPLYSRPGKIFVDGVERPTTNSEGGLLHPTKTGVQNFWRWFGGSKVIGTDNQPQRVFRGVVAGKEQPLKESWHTDSPILAGAYAQLRAIDGGEETIIPEYIVVKNPLIVNQKHFKQADADRVERQVMAEGFDGAIITGGPQTLYFVKDPTQVKSAVGNVGEFNGADSNILASRPRWIDWNALYTDPLSTSIDISHNPGAFNKIHQNWVEMFSDLWAKAPHVARTFGLAKSKKGTQQQAIKELLLDPFVKLGKESGLTEQELDDGWAGRHALFDSVNLRNAEVKSNMFVNELKEVLPKALADQLQKDQKEIRDDYDGTDAGADIARVKMRRLVDQTMSTAWGQGFVKDLPKVRDIYTRWERVKDYSSGYSTGEGDASVLEPGVPNARAAYDKVKDNPQWKEMDKLWQGLIRSTLDVLVEGDLLTPETAGKLAAKYKYYAPLRREGFALPRELQTLMSGGGKAIQERFGAEGYKKVINVMQNAFAQRDMAIAAAEKNLAMQVFAEDIKNNPGRWKGWFEVEERELTEQGKDDLGFETKTVGHMEPTDMSFMQGGRYYVIKPLDGNLRAAKIASAIQGLEVRDQSGPMKVMQAVNSWVRAVNVSLSPVFMVMNPPRDFSTALLNLQSTEIAGSWKDVAAEYKKSFFQLKKYYWTTDRDYADPDIKEVRGWEDEGGRMSFVQSLRPDDEGFGSVGKMIERRQGKWKIPGTTVELKSGVLGEAWTRAAEALDKIERANIMMENVMRFSTYKVFVREGMKKLEGERSNLTTEEFNAAAAEIRAQGAQLSKDITTNYDRKGFYAQSLGTFYLFFNATMQGNAQVMRNLLTGPNSKRMQKAVVGLMVTSLLLDLIAAGLSDDEDGDGRSDWDSIEDWRKEKQIFLPIGFGGEDKTYVSVPAPWVFNVFWRGGQMIGEVLRGVRSVESLGPEFAGLAATTMTPIGGKTFMQTVTPTALDPFMQIAENRGPFGEKIRPENFPGDVTPKSQLSWSSTSETHKWIAEELNRMTGGNAAESGFVDIAPGDVKILSDFVLGSTGGLFIKLAGGTVDVLSGKGLPEVGKVPGLKSYLVNPKDPKESGLFHERIALVHGAERARKIGEEPRREVGLLGYAKDAERQVKALRKQLRTAELQGRDEQAERVKKRIEGVYERFNQTWARRMGN